MVDIIFIIPTIGRESLKESIDSILNINLNKIYSLKIIIIFDGIKNSLPSYYSLLKNIIIIESDKVGILCKKNNAGLVRNIGFKYIIDNEISCKFISFLDDDDTISPNFIINLYKDNDKCDSDVIINRMMYKNYKIVPNPKTNKLIRNNVGISFVIKRKIIEDGNKFINSPYEDYIYLMNIKGRYKMILSGYVNYFVKTNYKRCEKEICIFPFILFN